MQLPLLLKHETDPDAWHFTYHRRFYCQDEHPDRNWRMVKPSTPFFPFNWMVHMVCFAELPGDDINLSGYLP
jgi:hypothetical protein